MAHGNRESPIDPCARHVDRRLHRRPAGAGRTIVASRDEVIGRGHAERLVPMIEEMLDGHVPARIIVGVGPGSFAGLRVGIAAAHGMAIGWSIPLSGMNSLPLLAASAPPGEGRVAAAMAGGHGELFVQTFDRKKFNATGPILNLAPGSGDEGRRPACRGKRCRGIGRGAPLGRGAAAVADRQPRPRTARVAALAGMQACLCSRAGRQSAEASWWAPDGDAASVRDGGPAAAGASAIWTR